MRFFAGFFWILLFGSTHAVAAELVMFESPECEWCEAWHEDVGIIYSKTEEAKKIPLFRMDIDAPRSGALSKIRPVMYTPTFVVMDKGSEIGRIMGYPGEDHFWGMLGEIVAKIDTPVNGCPTLTPNSSSTVKTAVC